MNYPLRHALGRIGFIVFATGVVLSLMTLAWGPFAFALWWAWRWW